MCPPPRQGPSPAGRDPCSAQGAYCGGWAGCPSGININESTYTATAVVYEVVNALLVLCLSWGFDTAMDREGVNLVALMSMAVLVAAYRAVVLRSGSFTAVDLVVFSAVFFAGALRRGFLLDFTGVLSSAGVLSFLLSNNGEFVSSVAMVFIVGRGLSKVVIKWKVYAALSYCLVDLTFTVVRFAVV